MDCRFLCCYGNYSIDLNFGEISGRVKRAQAKNLLKEFGEFGELSKNGVGFIKLEGNATQVYEKLLKIQSLVKSSDFNFGKDFENRVDTLVNNANTINTQIKETGRLSSENLSKISEAFSSEDYPEMTKALYDYRRGMIEATDVFDVLQECYEKDTKAYAEKLAENLSDSVDFYNSVLEYENDNITKLGEAYSKDFKNWTI